MAAPNIIIRGGTSSAANDQLAAKHKAEADARRAYDAQERRVARANPDQVKVFTRELGGVGKGYAVAVLTARNKDGSLLDYIICDLSFEEHGGEQMPLLVMVCPSCLHRYRKSVADSHITIRSWHRRFTLDSKRQGELWVNPHPPHDTYTLAGTINTHEKITCPTCSFRFEIDDGVIKEG